MKKPTTLYKGHRFPPEIIQYADDLIAQAQRQLSVSGGTPIQWHVAEAQTAGAIRTLLQQRGIQGVRGY
jgi:hypothetical protein